MHQNNLSNPSLGGFPRLRGVNLDGNDISALDLVAPSLAETLEWISLNDALVTDFSSLNGHPQLRYIWAERNNLALLSLEGLPKLHEIRIQRSGVEQVQLTNLPDLFNIDLGGNRLTDLTALSEFMTNQPTANAVSYTHLTLPTICSV